MPTITTRRRPDWADQAKAALHRDFPDCNIVLTDRGNWWALRGPLPPERMHEPDTVEATTPDELRAALTRPTTAAAA
ncbi:hypothetical protein [Actinomadura macra]|uniref:hypothetical protein n=1 Tax=Actinomadura macra TaxID=46164 RepID=UPI00082EC4C2|nr:hypothetical protein [Actinomadura macra]